ncbi:MAG: hypothetical protein AAFR32_11005, partial [Pseudomonadota bacterium]
MEEKRYLDANELLELSFALANQIIASGFVPSHIVGIWRGGAPIGIAVQELLEARGIDCDHIAIRTSSYTGIGQQARQVATCASKRPDDPACGSIFGIRKRIL